MRKYIYVFVGAVIIFNVWVTVQAEENNRKIVVFNKESSEEVREKAVKNAGGVKLKDLHIIGAKAVLLPDKAAVEKLRKDAAVLRIDDDVEVVYTAKGDTSSQPAQLLPWGIDRIDAELVWPGGNTADPIKVGVVDTGISKDHPDLTNNLKGGVNTINSIKGWNDDNGHGSHVAGTIAALNNTIGVVGVGPAVDLYAIKVLGANGSGFLSDVIEGIQWGVANGMRALNMSLGTASDVQSFHDAIVVAYKSGVVLVAAAGNNSGAVHFPAAYPEVIAVSATDSTNNLASFSSRGPEVDLAAPGVSIYSTYKGTGYRTLSGTSMAAPHVAGTVALVLNTPVGISDANANGKWDPAEVKTKLQNTAVDLGSTGFDILYGWGLVNAASAVK